MASFWLLFAPPEREGRPQPPQLFLLSLDGGEAQPLTELQNGAGVPEWSPNGKSLAFASSVRLEDPAKKAAKTVTEGGELKEPAAGAAERTPERVSDVRVITRATYRANGGGYLDSKRRTQIWTVGLPSGPSDLPKPKQVTVGNFDSGNFSWSPDGSRIYFVSNRIVERDYEQPKTDLYSVAATGGDEKKLITFDGGMRDYSFSNDGKWIAFGGATANKPVRSYTQPDLFVVENSAEQRPEI
jgi:Tol biopolymer transport system component